MIERQTNRHLKIFSLHQRFVFFLSYSKFRPFPFRVENEHSGEALSLWHLTSPAPFLPLDVGTTKFVITIYGREYLPEVKLSSPSKIDNRQRSFVLRRHAHTGPLRPLHLIPSAIDTTAKVLCLQVNFYKKFLNVQFTTTK